MKLFRIKSIGLSVLVLAVLASYGFTFDFQQWGKNQQENTAQNGEPAGSGQKVVAANVKRPVTPSLAQPVADTEIVEIQNQIQQITEHTKVVEQQSAADRAALQKVLQQVQIQKKLVDTLKVPKQPVPGDALNTDEIIRQAKLRLIAEDVRRTQEVLRTSKVVTPVPKPVQTVKTSDR